MLLTFNLGSTGKAATTGYTQYDTSGTQTVARTTSGVTEFGTTGVYYVSVTIDAATTLVVWNDTDTGLAGVDDLKPVLPSAQPGAANGVLISGSNAGTTTLAALTISGNTTFTGTTTFTGAITGSNASNNLRINGVAPGASGGILISGSNSGTTTLAALTVSGATTFTGAITGSNASNNLRINGAAPGASGGILISGSNSGTTTLGALTVTGATTFTGAITGSNASNNLRINGVAPGAAGGVFIAGTNAATSITTALTANITGNLSGSVGSVTGAVGSVTGLTASDVGAIKTKTDFLPSATAGAAGGVLIAGSNAATTFATFTCSGTFTVDTDVSFGTLTVNGAINVDGALNVTDFTMSSGMSITGNLSVGAGVTITQSTVNGHGLSITHNGTGKTINLAGAGYSIFTQGDIDIGGSVVVTDNLSIDGTLDVGVSLLPWNAAWDAEVQSEVQDAIEANHLDHLLAADYDPAAKPGVSTALFNELIGSDAGVSQFTANALELAPSGGGASAADIADAVWDEAQAGHVSAGSFGELATEIAAIKVKTDYLPSATAGSAGGVLIAGSNAATTFATFTVTTNAIAWNAAWDAEVQSEVTDALNAYDPPTNTEMVAAFTEIKGATWSSATDTLEAIRDRGDAAWATPLGIGSRSVTVTVNEGGSPLDNALVRLTNQSTSESFTGNTVGGVVEFSLNDATYTVTITLAGNTFTPTTLLVNGDETPTYSMTAVSSPTPSAPELCVVTGTFVDPNNEPLVGADIVFELKAARNTTTSGYVVQTTEWTVTTDAAGKINGSTGEELVRTDQFKRPNAHYEVTCTELGWSKKRLTLATGAYDLSSL